MNACSPTACTWPLKNRGDHILKGDKQRSARRILVNPATSERGEHPADFTDCRGSRWSDRRYKIGSSAFLSERRDDEA
jgi:hypothetical protein